MKTQKNQLYLLALFFVLTLVLLFFLSPDRTIVPEKGTRSNSTGLKLYWFIPDGLRADPTTFPIFQWAEEGLLPNLKKMMAQGSYGYSRPVFPSHTPTNFATLLTGATPKVHGIADGPMHIEGYPLKMVSKGGFSSIAKKVPPIWYTLEESGFHVTLLSVPGSTPPELDMGTTIRGRWGGWGMDFPAIIFHSATDTALRTKLGMDNRAFRFGSELTRFVQPSDSCNWQMPLPKSYNTPKELLLKNWGQTLYACVIDTSDDQRTNYDQVVFSEDRQQKLTQVKEKDWSPWIPTRLSWQTQNDYNIFTPKRMAWERGLSSIPVNTEMAINVIKLGDSDFFRIRILYNNLNAYLVKPSDLAPQLHKALGPMVDFPDNYPPQLIYYPEDKETFLTESRRSLTWHKNAVSHLLETTQSDMVIHDIYTPNQMLSSRWWLSALDPVGRNYSKTPEKQRQKLWQEVLEMYQGIDAILGEILTTADPNTLIVFGSDHGMVPLNREVRLNNLFAQKGLLSFSKDSETGIPAIDWQKTKVIFLKMDNIYINPDGLAGNYNRPSDPRYEQLRDDVIHLLTTLKDENGQAPIAKIVKWEEAESVLDLPNDRVGDLVIANIPTYGWVEDVTADLKIFDNARKSGYKQAILPKDTDALLTPFVVMGPGVQKNNQIKKPIRHIDQYPTIMTLLHQPIPDFVEGKALREVLEQEGAGIFHK